MSHFTVLVIGDDIEKQLEPFKEEGWFDGGKWDWWILGGRWTGFFKLKPGVVGVVGEPGCATDAATEGYADQARKGEIDFDAMRDEYAAERLESYRLFHQTVAGRPIPDWEEIRTRHGDNIDAARSEWRENPVNKDLDALPGYPFSLSNYDEYKAGIDEFEAFARQKAVTTFAVLKDGQWCEKGKMGWWGAVSDEKDPAEWVAEFHKLLEALPDDTLLSVVDCHI